MYLSDYKKIRILARKSRVKTGITAKHGDKQAAGMNEVEARAMLTKFSCAQAENSTAAWKNR